MAINPVVLRKGLWVASVSVVIAFSLVVLVLLTITAVSVRQNVNKLEETTLLAPSLVYVPVEGFLTTASACRGGTLPPFSFNVVVARPTIVHVYVTWIPVVGGPGAQSGDDHAQHYPYLEPGSYRVDVKESRVPMGLVAGVYRRVVAAQAEHADLASYQQVVTVEDCD